jgi:RHS repeat-associated protein
VNDPDTGLVYMQARYYDPITGRFLSIDPAEPIPGSLFHFNRYDYANNNPIINTDPDGRCVDADWSCGAIARSLADHPEARKPMEPAAKYGAGVMLSGTGLGAAVEVASIIRTVHNAVEDSTPIPTTLQKNVAQGKAGEAATRAKYGDRIAG